MHPCLRGSLHAPLSLALFVLVHAACVSNELPGTGAGGRGGAGSTPSTGGASGTGPGATGGSGNTNSGVAGTTGQAGSAAAGTNGTGGQAGSAVGGDAAAGTLGAGGTATGGTAGSGGGGSSEGGAAGTSSGAGGAAPASAGCAGTKYKLCEDFESGNVGEYPTGWTVFQGYSAGAASDVGLSTEQFHSGKMALKSSSTDKGQRRVQKALAALGATASKHWGRIFYRAKSPEVKPPSGVLHVTWVGLYGTGENRIVDIVENTSGKHQWLYNNPNDQGSLGSSYDWSFDDAWHCAEWYIDVSTKSYRFFSDSTEVTQISFMNKADAQMSDYKNIIVGGTFYQTGLSGPFTIWFDDLAIDDARIGCK